MKKISHEKLDSYSSEKLLDLLDKSFIARALARKDSKLSSKDIGIIQKEIVKTVWKNFPKVAKKEGFKKFRS
jgi:predicted mannosyl-3-phosphoglycerate phosphatase (HAD superfamily)